MLKDGPEVIIAIVFIFQSNVLTFSLKKSELAILLINRNSHLSPTFFILRDLIRFPFFSYSEGYQ